MGGVSAGYINPLTINYSNPASYAWFLATREGKSKKLTSGRAVLDIGMNIESRTLIEPGNNSATNRFAASNILFSHVQVGIPLRSNWGLSFGIRPMNRISYKMSKYERLYDPNTGQNIDTAQTLNEGDGGAYLPTIGTGVKFKTASNQWLGIGVNAGYLFGKKDYATRRVLFNDTVAYTAGNWQTKTNYGGMHFDLGLQYYIEFANKMNLTIGASGNVQHNMNASQDRIRETYFFDESSGYVRIDSVSDIKDIDGKITYPTSFTVGFVLKKPVIPGDKKGGWTLGLDFQQRQWSSYRFYGQPDLLRNSWEARVGGELYPVPRTNYFSNVVYRAGLFAGGDYVEVGNKLPLMGASLGIGLPVFSRSSQSRNQFSLINLAFEYIKRGNNDNILKENLFRMSVGFALSDLWFGKRKYD